MKAENFYKSTEDDLNHLYSGLYELNESDLPILSRTPREIPRWKRGAMGLLGSLFIAGTVLFSLLPSSGCVMPSDKSKPNTQSKPPEVGQEIVKWNPLPTYLTPDQMVSTTDNITDIYPCHEMTSDNITIVNIPSIYNNPNLVMYSSDELPRIASKISEVYQIPGEALHLTSPGIDKLFVLDVGREAYVFQKFYQNGVSENLTNVFAKYGNGPLHGTKIRARSIFLPNNNEKNAFWDDIIDYLKQDDPTSIIVPPEFQIVRDLNCQPETVIFDASGGKCCDNKKYDITIYRFDGNPKYNKKEVVGIGKTPYEFTFGPDNISQGEEYTEFLIEVKSPDNPNQNPLLYISRRVYCPISTGGGGGGGGDGGGCGGGPGGGHGG